MWTVSVRHKGEVRNREREREGRNASERYPIAIDDER
jgi:hypothetical protein